MRSWLKAQLKIWGSWLESSETDRQSHHQSRLSQLFLHGSSPSECNLCTFKKWKKKKPDSMKRVLGTEESQRAVCFRRESPDFMRAYESVSQLRCFILMRLIHHGSGAPPNTLTLCKSLRNCLCCQPFCLLPRKGLWTVQSWEMGRCEKETRKRLLKQQQLAF